MKSFFATIVLLAGLLAQVMSFAQTNRKTDQIVKRNKQVVQAIITEINDTQVLYRDPTKPKNSLPITINRSDISKLVYANGQEEIIEHGNDPKPDTKTGKVSIFVTASGGAGMMSSTEYLDVDYKSTLMLSYSGGLGVHIPIGSYVAISPMATFTQFGGKFLDATDATVYTKLSYQSAQLSMPILGTFPLGDIQFFGGAGPYINYAFTGSQIDGDPTEKIESEFDFQKEKQPFHFGAMAQAGVKVKMVSVFGYYTRSLSPLEIDKTIVSTASTFGLGLKVHF